MAGVPPRCPFWRVLRPRVPLRRFQADNNLQGVTSFTAKQSTICCRRPPPRCLPCRHMSVDSSRPSTSIELKAMCHRVARNLSGRRPSGSAGGWAGGGHMPTADASSRVSHSRPTPPASPPSQHPTVLTVHVGLRQLHHLSRQAVGHHGAGPAGKGQHARQAQHQGHNVCEAHRKLERLRTACAGWRGGGWVGQAAAEGCRGSDQQGRYARVGRSSAMSDPRQPRSSAGSAAAHLCGLLGAQPHQRRHLAVRAVRPRSGGSGSRVSRHRLPCPWPAGPAGVPPCWHMGRQARRAPAVPCAPPAQPHGRPCSTPAARQPGGSVRRRG